MFPHFVLTSPWHSNGQIPMRFSPHSHGIATIILWHIKIFFIRWVHHGIWLRLPIVLGSSLISLQHNHQKWLAQHKGQMLKYPLHSTLLTFILSNINSICEHIIDSDINQNILYSTSFACNFFSPLDLNVNRHV
jgi:hypothetical protein